MAKAAKPRRRVTVIQRVAIGELCEMGILLSSSKRPGVRHAAVLMLERAAMIYRGSTKPFFYADGALADFVQGYQPNTPAKFAPDAKKAKKR